MDKELEKIAVALYFSWFLKTIKGQAKFDAVSAEMDGMKEFGLSNGADRIYHDKRAFLESQGEQMRLNSLVYAIKSAFNRVMPAIQNGDNQKFNEKFKGMWR